MSVDHTHEHDQEICDSRTTGSEYGLGDLASDRPITIPEDDRLGRASFAEAMAHSIVTMTGTDGLTIALYGRWGSGKTSTLELVSHYLHQETGESAPLVVKFNPWWFSEPEAILVSFFLQIQGHLKGKGDQKLRRAIADYGGVIGGTLGVVPGCSGVADLAKSLSKVAGRYDIHKLRAQIDGILRAEQRRIVVIVDDIDRLASDEIRQVFQLVRAVADFPNIVYLLAFDPVVVADALGDVQKGSGHDYIDKIVQVPLHLPMPSRHAKRDLFVASVNSVIGDSADAGIDEQRWAKVFLEGIDPLLRSMRDVKRYANALRITWPLVRGEVDTADYLGAEAVRVFIPELYVDLRDAKEFLCGGMRDGFLQQPKREELTVWHERVIEGVADPDRRSVAQKLLSALFPKFHSSFGGSTYGSGWEDGWRQERRICSAERFDIYFRLNVPEDFVSDAEMEATIASLDRPGEFAQRLLEMAEQRVPGHTVSRARRFLERLHDYVGDQIPEEDIATFIDELYQVADTLISLNDRDGFLPFQNDTVLAWLTDAALRRLSSSSERAVLLHNLVEKSPSPAAVVLYVCWCEQISEDAADRESLVGNEEALAEFREAALVRIRASAKDGSIRQLPRLGFVLSAWRKWAGDEPAVSLVKEWTSSDKGMADFIARMLGYSIDEVPQGGRIDPGILIGVGWTAYFADIAHTRERVQTVLAQPADWVSDSHIEALNTFVRETSATDKTGDANGAVEREEA